jgi:hypothetical protein
MMPGGHGVNVHVAMRHMPHPAAGDMKHSKGGDRDGANDAEYFYPAWHFIGGTPGSLLCRYTVGIRMHVTRP